MFHVTTKGVLASIRKRGIDPKYSKGSRRECWYVPARLVPWAMLHVAGRHKVAVEETIALEVSDDAGEFVNRGRSRFTLYTVVEWSEVNRTVIVDQIAGGVLDEELFRREE